MPTAPLPPFEELLERTHIVAIQTRTRFRGVSVREAAIFEAPNGASEFSPFVEYKDQEAASWLAAAIEFGWGELPEFHRSRIAVNATVPAVSAAEVPAVLARFDGCRTAKVKVAERGQHLSDDIARVRAVREAMGGDALVRIDANGGWSVDEAVTALRALAEFDLDYAEQPCMNLDELVEVRSQLTPTRSGGGQTGSPLVRIAADESVRKAEDPLAVAKAGAADLLIVKAQPLGGIARALEIIKAAELPVVVSSALDTSVGIGMGLHLAAALPEGALAGACGLGTVALLDGDVTDRQLIAENGEIEVRRAILDPELLEQHAAEPERERWWRERIARCHRLLAQQTG
jgi:O-succinylbenzoate synthase